MKKRGEVIVPSDCPSIEAMAAEMYVRSMTMPDDEGYNKPKPTALWCFDVRRSLLRRRGRVSQSPLRNPLMKTTLFILLVLTLAGCVFGDNRTPPPSVDAGPLGEDPGYDPGPRCFPGPCPDAGPRPDAQ